MGFCALGKFEERVKDALSCDGLQQGEFEQLSKTPRKTLEAASNDQSDASCADDASRAIARAILEGKSFDQLIKDSKGNKDLYNKLTSFSNNKGDCTPAVSLRPKNGTGVRTA